MKRTLLLVPFLFLILASAACSSIPNKTDTFTLLPANAVDIHLSDDKILVNGIPATADSANAAFVANDIVYYESGHDFTYGEGTEADAHDAETAAMHTVVHIVQTGTYNISGTLSRGQIAVDLGENAKNDPEAVVTLILNGTDITCEVAPAVIFYNVYECGSTDADSATKDVDTAKAGANVLIADGTVNNMRGSYVARIYKPDSVVVNADGTEIEDAKKLHKYDGAFYSRMSMNIDGGIHGTGVLNIHAANEGLDSELHLTINGGNINIISGNDGINTNEDGISVTTINGGTLSIQVNGETGEGDGIDSNGWLVINDGTVIAAACSDSADAGIDSDMGIHINGGTVIASGHMLDRIENGGQTYAVFSFTATQDGGKILRMKSRLGRTLHKFNPKNRYSVLIYSSPELKSKVFTLWYDDQQLEGQTGGGMGQPNIPSGMPPQQNGETPTFPKAPPPYDENFSMNGFSAKDFHINENSPPMEQTPPEKPTDEAHDSNFRPEGFPNDRRKDQLRETTKRFQISDGANMFGSLAPIK